MHVERTTDSVKKANRAENLIRVKPAGQRQGWNGVTLLPQ